MYTPLIIIVSLFVLNWIIRILIRKNPGNKSQKKHFISILNAWKEALDSEQEKTEQLIQQDQSNFPDSLDRAAKEEEFMLELRKRERERKLISKIELSLKDIDDDLYGYCETCGVEIGIKRLEARPTATQCID